MIGDLLGDFFGQRRRNPGYGRPYDDSYIDSRHYQGEFRHPTGDPFDPFRDPFFSHGMMMDPFREMERTMREADNMMKAMMGGAFHGPGQFAFDPFGAIEGNAAANPRDRMLRRSPSYDGIKIEEITDDTEVNDSKSKTSQPIITHPSDALVPSTGSRSHQPSVSPQQPRQAQPIIHGFSSVYSKTFTGDGRVQEYQAYRDTSGNYSEKNARSVNGKTVAVTQKRKGHDAQPEIEEDYINLDGSELDQFEREWRAGTSRLPRIQHGNPASSNPYDSNPSGGPLRIEGSYSRPDQAEGGKKSWKDYLPKIF